MKLILIPAVVVFVSLIPAANWLIGNWGTVCIPNGPCLIPVGFGFMAPSGVLLVGLAFVLRDYLHERLGGLTVLGLVGAGAVLSFLLADPRIALASALAFTFSEMNDTLIYTWLREKSRALAVAVSGVGGAVVDSALFSWFAFGTLAWQPGLLLAKIYASVLVAVWLCCITTARR